MGNYLSKIMGNKIKKVLILGHSKSGKTTIYQVLNKKFNNRPEKIEESVSEGFNVDIIKQVVIWDLSGDKTMMPFWSCYYNNVDGIIWVLDASRTDEEIVNDMYSLLTSKELEKTKLLFYIHKSDLANEDDIKKLREEVERLFQNRVCKIISSSIMCYKPIYTGFNWLNETVNASKPKRFYII